jgi:hypothetical protein
VPHWVSIGAIGDSLLPFLKPSLSGTYVAREFGKPRVEPNTTLRLMTQATTGPPHSDLDLSPD